MKKFFIIIFLIFLPMLVFAQAEKKKALFFYSENCLHCKEVKEYFQKEKIYEEYEIREIDVAGEYNLAYLNDFFDSFGIKQEKRGWPAVFFGNEILVGSVPIIENFKSKMEESGAYEFPAPADVEKSLSKMREKMNYKEQLSWSTAAIILGAGLADSINPCIFAVVFFLLFILRPACVRSKFLLAIAGFFVAIFSVRLLSGIFIYKDAGYLNFFRPILAISGILSATLGIFSLKYSLQNITQPILNTKISFFSKKQGIFIKGLLIGIIASLFILPNVSEPYVPFIKIIAERMNIFPAIIALSIYNFLFIIPLLLLVLFISWSAKKERAQNFYRKNKMLIRVTCGAAMVFIGAYIVKVSFQLIT